MYFTSQVRNNRFNVAKVLTSFSNPRDSLFVESAKAEMKRHPELIAMTAQLADDDPPKILFSSRRYASLGVHGVGPVHQEQFSAPPRAPPTNATKR